MESGDKSRNDSDPRSRRHHTDEYILNKLSDVFSGFVLHDTPLNLLRIGPSFRPSNEKQVLLLKERISKGYRRCDALVVWRTPTIPYRIVSGNDLYEASHQALRQSVPCLFLDCSRDAAPTEKDLLFAHQRVSLFDRDIEMPRSVLSKLIEVRTIFCSFQAENVPFSNVDIRKLRSKMPSTPRGDVQPFVTHWAETISDIQIRKYLECAKLLHASNLCQYINDIEELSFNRHRITAKTLFSIAKGEKLSVGFGKQILERMLRRLLEDDSIILVISPEERSELKRLEKRSRCRRSLSLSLIDMPEPPAHFHVGRVEATEEEVPSPSVTEFQELPSDSNQHQTAFLLGKHRSRSNDIELDERQKRMTTAKDIIKQGLYRIRDGVALLKGCDDGSSLEDHDSYMDLMAALTRFEGLINGKLRTLNSTE